MSAQVCSFPSKIALFGEGRDWRDGVLREWESAFGRDCIAIGNGCSQIGNDLAGLGQHVGDAIRGVAVAEDVGGLDVHGEGGGDCCRDTVACAAGEKGEAS